MHPGRMVVNLLVLAFLIAITFWLIVRVFAALLEVMGA
jgi:hypothetical protein